jgi:hypothetical protein
LTESNKTTRLTPKKDFKCCLCDEITKNSNKGGSFGNSLLPPEDICSKCIHKNYCWATDKDLTQHSYNVIEKSRRDLIGVIYT